MRTSGAGYRNRCIYLFIYSLFIQLGALRLWQIKKGSTTTRSKTETSTQSRKQKPNKENPPPGRLPPSFPISVLSFVKKFVRQRKPLPGPWPCCFDRSWSSWSWPCAWALPLEFTLSSPLPPPTGIGACESQILRRLETRLESREDLPKNMSVERNHECTHQEWVAAEPLLQPGNSRHSSSR